MNDLISVPRESVKTLGRPRGDGGSLLPLAWSLTPVPDKNVSNS